MAFFWSPIINLNNRLMLLTYFKAALRNARRHLSFTVINIWGLSIGISAAIVIFLLVQYEFSFDRSVKDREQVYRIVMNMKFNGNDGYSAATPAPLSVAMKAELNGIDVAVPLIQFQGDATATVQVQRPADDQPTMFKKQANIIFTNPGYFSIQQNTWLSGNADVSLGKPFQVVLTQTRAQQYFPGLAQTAIIGKTIRYNDDFNCTIAGIVSDADDRSSIAANEFISFATIAETHMQRDFMMDTWNDWMAYTQVYVKLEKTAKAPMIEKQLNHLFAKYNPTAKKDEANYIQLKLQPLNDVHFNANYAGLNQRLAHRPTMWALLAVATFLLLLACINYINLTTANATQRAREIGVRKTMGSSRGQLIAQFLSETFVFTLAACCLSVALSPLLLKAFAGFIPAGLSFEPLKQPVIFVFLLILAIVVSLLAGLYPALILSGYKPVNVLKNVMVRSSETRHAGVRRMLTTSQFVIAQFFVLATVMVGRQIHYTLTADMGFRKDAVVTIGVPYHDTSYAKRNDLLASIRSMPGVQQVSRGFMTPADQGAAFTQIEMEGAAFTQIEMEGAANENKESVQLRWGDEQYLSLFKIPVITGRNVNPSDTIREFLVNETYAKLLGFKEPAAAVGRLLVFNGKQMPIVGVMKDFNESSLRSHVGPIVFASNNKNSYNYHILLHAKESGTWSRTLDEIGKVYHRLYPDADYKFTFLDDTIAGFYAEEQRTAGLLNWATGLSVLISCLGLLGLVIYTLNTRTKEIGVRKILGASVFQIVGTLSKGFLKPVMIAFLIAAPVAWWAVNKWLQDFAYRTSMNIGIFLLCGFALMLLALLVLSVNTIRAARANPVKNLRMD
jgi:putative ABC transport system permease protein